MYCKFLSISDVNSNSVLPSRRRRVLWRVEIEYQTDSLSP